MVSKAVAGDHEALSELLQQHAPAMRRKLARAIGDAWRSSVDAEDVMQVTFLEAFLRINRFQPGGAGSFSAWLSRIAENNLRDAIKWLSRAKRPDPRRRVGAPGGEESYVGLVEMLGASMTTPSRAAARGEALGALEKMIAELPTDYERVIRLYDLEGRSASEVAELLDRSPGAVFMLRARAHDCLRELLGSASQYFTVTG